MAGERAQIVGAAVTHVGKVREHNEDAHFLDADLGLFVVCDGMGGHAAGEVASALAIRTIRARWSDQDTLKMADASDGKGTHEAKKQLLATIRGGVVAAHDAILAEAARDDAKKGMGTTLVGAMIVGGDVVFAHAGDSRAYLVRDHIAMQLTEDHTLLARLTAAGIDVDVEGEGSRFKSMLTNALGIGEECRIATFIVPLADGDRFLLCSDGISEYITEAEVGEVLTKQPSPARAAGKLVEMALERGGGDNATALVVRVLEAGETPQPAEMRRRDDEAIKSCVLWKGKVTPQQRLRALRIAIPRDYVPGDQLLAQTLGGRVAWILIEGEVEIDGKRIGAGGLLYPECLVEGSQTPERDGLAVAKTDVRALALRSDDFRELCDDDSELGEALQESLAELISNRRSTKVVRRTVIGGADVDPRSATDPNLATVPRPEPKPPAPERPPPPDKSENRIPPVVAELDKARPPPTPPLKPVGKPIPKITEARPPSEVKITKLGDAKVPPIPKPPEPKWMNAETRPDVKADLRPPAGKPPIHTPLAPVPKTTPPTGSDIPPPTRPSRPEMVAELPRAKTPTAPRPPNPPIVPLEIDHRAETDVEEDTGQRLAAPPKASDGDLPGDDSGVAVLIVAGPPVDMEASVSSPLVESLLNLIDSGAPELDLANDVLSLEPPISRAGFGRAMTADPHIETYELDRSSGIRAVVTPVEPEFEEEDIAPLSVEGDVTMVRHVSLEGDAVTMVRQSPLFAGDHSLDVEDEDPLPGETTLVVKLPVADTRPPEEPEHAPKHTPITSEDTNIASGTISTPDAGPRRAKRLTDGWSDD